MDIDLLDENLEALISLTWEVNGSVGFRHCCIVYTLLEFRFFCVIDFIFWE